MKSVIRKVVICYLVASCIASSASALSFPDVNDYDEYSEAIAYVSDNGVMVGDDQGMFNPNKTVTRAEMATIICRMLGEFDVTATSTTFSDVPITHWANKYVTKASSLGIVNGIGDGKFGPSTNVTYEQALTMIVRAAFGSNEAESRGGYPDGYIYMAAQNGWLEGVSATRGEVLSRADIAMMIYNYYMNTATIRMED